MNVFRNFKYIHKNIILFNSAGLGMWSILVVQSEQHLIYRLMGGDSQANMEEADGERLP